MYYNRTLVRGASEPEFEISCLFVSISVMISDSPKFSLNDTLFLCFTYLWLCFATLCDIRRDLNVDRALFLGYKYHQKKRDGITEEHTRGMPKIDDKSQYNHAERREVEPVWFEVLQELV
jgi:hypothetical protein